MNVQATRGSTGNALLYGFDIHGAGIQVDSSYKESILFTQQADKDTWKYTRLVNLINSSISSLNLIAIEIEHKKFSLFDKCKYTKTKGIYYVQIGKREFRIKGTKILELKL